MTRTLIVAAAMVVLAVVLILNLAILDILTVAESKESVLKFVSVAAVTTIGVVAVLWLARLGKPRDRPSDD